jgi:CRP-like cAMP-binding protein
MNKSSTLPLEEILKIPLFMELEKEEVLPIIEAAHEKHLRNGEFFYFQGDQAEYMYLLTQGQVKLIQVGQDGKQALFQVIDPIALFGLVAMTTTDLYPVAAQTVKESHALYWTRHELMSYVLKLPQMALNAMKIMSDQLEEIQDRFRQVTTQRVEQRLAHTLIRLAAQAGKKVDEGILIDLAITRQDLAEMSGTTLYTASRMLSQWDGQKLVIAGREKVIIRNPHGLARIIEGLRR